MSVYRMTLRFNLEDALERGAAEYLQKLRHGDGNRFVVGAVLARIQAENDDPVDFILLNSILLWLLIDELRLSEYIAPLIILMITVPTNFVLNKYWSFKTETIDEEN